MEESMIESKLPIYFVFHHVPLPLLLLRYFFVTTIDQVVALPVDMTNI